MKKNSFLEGTIIAYAAIVITKILGMLYSIPLYNIIGEAGGVIYSCAYNIYSLFLDISTAGIPIAVSIIISEYNTLGMYKSKEKTYRISMYLVMGLSFLSFLVLQFFAWPIGEFFLDDMDRGVRMESIAAAVRVISICVLVAPFLSIKRGYLQGHKFLAAPSKSQVIEQLVRVAVVLVGVYITVVMLRLEITVGVCVALSGAAVGAFAALIYLEIKSHGAPELRTPEVCDEARPVATSEILRKVFSYCITIVIMTVSISIYNLVDMKMLLKGLHSLRMPDMDVQVIASISSTWVTKICMIISALATGLVSSIAPHMAESNSTGDRKGINDRLNQALKIVLLVAVPMGVGMILLSEPIYRVFYGPSRFGPEILELSVIVNIIGSMVTVTSMSMQSIGRGRTVCIVIILGIIVNAGMDLPLIYLFNLLGLPPYLGAVVSSILGQGLTLFLLLGSLKRVYHFLYMPILRTFLLELPGVAVMGAVVLALRHFWPALTSRLLLVPQLAVFAAVGGVIFLGFAYKMGVIADVIGADVLDKLLRRLRLRRG